MSAASATSARPLAGTAAGGMACAVAANFLFATSDAVVKSLAGRYSIFQIVPMQVVFAALPILVVLWCRTGCRLPRPVHPRLVVLRGLLAGVGTLTGYHAFSQLPLADVYAIMFAVPILVTLLAIPVLGERVGPYRWTAVVVGFLGVLVMVRPGSAAFSTGHLAAFASVVTGASVALILRKVARDEDPAVMVLSVVLGLLAASLPVAAFVAVMPTARDVAVLACSGFLMAAAQLLLLQAYRTATAASVAPMQYSAMLWAIGFGCLMFGDVVQPHVLAGTGVVALSSLFIMHRERRVRAA